ncbi:MAG: cupin domain-containing protein [Deltaproteobacteria bacterium]|nr:cupin domain-containing protein [Deltaproteobacteria bacterium]
MAAHRPAVILRADDVARAELPFAQRLDPKSRFTGTSLARLAGLVRTGVSRARIPPGGQAFTYHAHLGDEEWIYIVSGRARARIDGREHDLGPGDFAAFPAPQAAHVLANPFDEECVYLMGGERSSSDVIDYPDLGKRFALVREPTRVAFHELGPAQYPFGRADQPPAQAPAPWRVIATRGCGSVIVEAGLVLAGLPYEREEIDYAQPGSGRDRLLAVNPLGQVPTVIMPDGAVMSETSALLLHLDELVPAAGLFPAAGDPLRRTALRWLAFLVAAVYPTFTYGDDPARWAGDAGAKALEVATHEHRRKLWQQLEGVAAAAPGPWFLGARWSALDLYVCAMTRWRPNRPWFAAHAPKLHAIALAVDADPRLAALWAANF